MRRTPKVGDLVRATETASPSDARGRLAIVVAVKKPAKLFPFVIRFLDGGEYCPMSRREIELPEETQDAHNCG